MAVGCDAQASTEFERLVVALKQALGPESGLTSDGVDLNHLTHLMEQYDAKGLGWLPYYFEDASRGYTRNLVDRGNGKSNLVRWSTTSHEGCPGIVG